METKAESNLEIDTIQFENIIHPEARFATRENMEYHVFSNETEDPSSIEKWVGIHQPVRVLMDPVSYAKLKNNRIQWIFDDNKVLVGCTIIQ